MELGGSEMILIFFIALVVLGPDELVKYAVKGGRAVAKLRTQFENFKTMTQEELMKRANSAELKELSDINRDLKNLGQNLQKSTQDLVEGTLLKNDETSEKSEIAKPVTDELVLQVKDESEIETQILMMRNNKKS